MEASRAALVQEPFRAEARFPSAATRGLDFARSPVLGGYAVVNARGRATELLAASDEDPLLIQWQHGVGRSAVFATDVGAELGRPWLSWPGYGVLFDQLARDLSRSPERRDARVSLEVRGGVGHVRVEAVSAGGEYRNYLELGGTVAAPGGRSENVTLRQTGAGRYEGTFPADAPGPYLVTVREGEGDAAAMVGSAGVVQQRGGELRGEGTNTALLGQIAALTGGVVRNSLDQVFADRPPPTYAYQPLWPHLLASALVLFLLSVTLRRLVLPESLFRRRPKKRPLRASPAVARSATLETLTAKRRERREDEPPPELRALDDGLAPRAPKHPVPDESNDDALPPAPADAGSLAEQLLAKKKRR